MNQADISLNPVRKGIYAGLLWSRCNELIDISVVKNIKVRFFHSKLISH